jgi:ABC-type antimicrobial peptide transport system permease subunit
MNFRDLIATASGNLRRMKLRSFLTISGIVIAIAAFVSMLSFGAGMQMNITEQFDKLGLLSIIQVYPGEAGHSDSTSVTRLDEAALERLENIPGVELVYPFESLELMVTPGDSVRTVSAQALPHRAVRTKLFSNIVAGTPFRSDSSREALVSEEVLGLLGFESADSIIARPVIVSARMAKIDSGVVAAIQPLSDIIRAKREAIDPDSLRDRDYARRIIHEELSGALKRFADGFMNNREIITDTLTVCGVLEPRRIGHLGFSDMILPVETARKFSSAGFSGDPTEILMAVQTGRLFSKDPESRPDSYSRATVVMEIDALYGPIRDSINATGFRTFSFAEEFDDIRRFFRYFNLALGLVGLIALITASLGIVNTLVMSITERRREIGIWMSLGADMWDIRRLFLVESGLIGLTGAIAGVIFGWVISRIGSLVAKSLMESEGVPPMEMFHVPPWLVLSALIFGVLVSLLAGYYPASRAAGIDPVESLRNE